MRLEAGAMGAMELLLNLKKHINRLVNDEETEKKERYLAQVMLNIVWALYVCMTWSHCRYVWMKGQQQEQWRWERCRYGGRQGMAMGER